MGMLVILILILVGFALWVAAVYNKLKQLLEIIGTSGIQINTQLDHRYKVFESLISTIQTYMDYNSTPLKEVEELRHKAQLAIAKGDEKERIAAEEGISKIAANLPLFFDSHPDLKSNTNITHLTEEIVNIENKLAHLKRAYNENVERYTTKKNAISESIIVGIFNEKLNKSFFYWDINQENAAN